MAKRTEKRTISICDVCGREGMVLSPCPMCHREVCYQCSNDLYDVWKTGICKQCLNDETVYAYFMDAHKAWIAHRGIVMQDLLSKARATGKERANGCTKTQ